MEDKDWKRIIENPWITTDEKTKRIAQLLQDEYSLGVSCLYSGCVLNYIATKTETIGAEDPRTKDVWKATKPLLDEELERRDAQEHPVVLTQDNASKDEAQQKQEHAEAVEELLSDILFDPNELVRRTPSAGGRQYVSDVIDMNELTGGKLNLIFAPPGSGKTTFIEGTLKEYAKRFSRELLYLAPTRNLIDALNFRGHVNEIKLKDGSIIRKWKQDGITAMTYASFGSQIIRESKNGRLQQEEWWHEDALICLDELSHAVQQSYYPNKSEGGENVTRRALDELVERCKNESNIVVTLSATPKAAVDYFFLWNHVNINVIKSTLDLKGYENAETIEYYDLDSLLRSLDPSKRGMIYIGQVRSVKHAVGLLRDRGIHAVGIWSENNPNPMDEEQRRVALAIAKDEMVPDDVQVLVFNAAYETGVNIKPEKSRLDYAVVHNSNESVVIQARGRYRGDIDTLYIKTKNDNLESLAAEIDDEIVEPYLGIPLKKDDKRRLVEALGLKNKNGRPYGWGKTAEAIRMAGYVIAEKRNKKFRYSIIRRIERSDKTEE